MIALGIIVGVIVFAGLAYWRFGDPDRSERLSAMIGPTGPLMLIVLSSINEVISLREGSIDRIGVWLLLTAIWVWIYLRDRAASKRATGSEPHDAMTDLRRPKP